MSGPGKIVVDLTPVLPGGENGGAKVFALRLVADLAAIAPETKFVLLTQAASHEELGALDRDNVRRLQVIGPRASAGRSRVFGVAARAVGKMPAWARSRAARAGYLLNAALKRGGSSRLLRDLEADLLFCPFTAPTFREPGVPTVCTIYDVQYRDYPQFFGVEDVAQRDRAFTDACRHATRLAAISAYSRESAIAAGSIDPARIRAIPLAVVAPADRHPGRRDSGDGPGSQEIGPRPSAATAAAGATRYFLYPANFWKHKNHEMLLTAFGMACAAGLPEDVRLICTGEAGERRDWLAHAARALGLGDRVVFPGFLGRDDYAAMLAGAHGLVFPSLYEGFGLPVVEAMAAGVPVACSNVTSLPEVAGDAALTFDPRIPGQVAAAMVALATDEALRERLVAKGRERAASFAHPERVAAAYLELFAEALAHREERAAA